MHNDFLKLSQKNEQYRSEVERIKQIFHVWNLYIFIKSVSVMECFLQKPASNLNQLNTIVPDLIEQNNITETLHLIEALELAKLITSDDYRFLVADHEQPTDKIVSFISQRVRVLLQSLCTNVTTGSFDALTKQLL